MDPFAELDFLRSEPQTQKPSPQKTAPAPAATGFNFIASSANNAPAAAAASSSGFNFMGSPAGSTSAPLDLFSTLTSPQATAPQGSGLDALFSAIGEVQNASLPSMGASIQSGASLADDTDFSKLSVSALKSYLSSKHVPAAEIAACMEKKDLVALATGLASRSGAKAATVPSFTVQHASHAGVPSAAAASSSATTKQAPSSSSAASRTALEMGLPNAFEVTGFSRIAPQGAASSEHDRQYRLAAGGTQVTGLEAFRSAAAKIPVSQLPVPHIPHGKLRVRLPASVLDPVIREVTGSLAKTSGTEYAAAAQAAGMVPAAAAATTAPTTAGQPPALTEAQKLASLLPWLAPAPGAAAHAGTATAAGSTSAPVPAATLVGPARWFEVPIRPDISDALLLAALSAAAVGAALTVTSRSSRSVVLQQRVSVPSPSYSAFVSGPAVVGMGAAGSGVRHPVVVHAGQSTAGVAGAGLAQALNVFKSRTVYVNAVAAFLGTNASGERVLLLHGARYIPAGVSAAELAGGTGSAAEGRYGRLVEKERVGGTASAPAGAVKKGGASAAASSDPLSGLMQLASAGSGVLCAMVHKRSSAVNSYRSSSSAVQGGSGSREGISSSRRGRKGTAQGGAAPAADSDDPFGMLAPGGASAGRHNEEESGEEEDGTEAGCVERTISTQEADLQYIPSLSKQVRSEAESGPGVDQAADAWERGKDAQGVPVTVLDVCEASPGWDDSSEAILPASEHGSPGVQAAALPAWSDLRVSFLDADVRTTAAAAAAAAAGAGAGGGSSTAAASLASDLAGLALGAGTGSSMADGSSASSTGPSTFAATDVEDELVQLQLALAADLRGQRVTSDGLWADALERAKQAVAGLRGEVLPEPPLPGPANAIISTESGAVPAVLPLQVHPDSVSALFAGHRAAGERVMFPIAQLYEDRCKAEERTAAAVGKMTAPAFASAGLRPSSMPPIPTLAQMPLEVLPPDEPDCPAAPLAPTPTAARMLRDEELPEALTPTEGTLREIYMRAYLACRRMHRAWAVTSQVQEQKADIEIKARLQRKIKHSGLRCGAALYHCAQLLSQLQVRAASAPMPAAPSAASDSKDKEKEKEWKKFEKIEPGRALLASVFGVTGEAPVAHFTASSGWFGASVSGDVLLTPTALYLTTGNILTLGTTRHKRAIHLDSIVAVTRSSSMLSESVVVTYVDDDKAKRLLTQAQAQAGAAVSSAPAAAASSTSATAAAPAPPLAASTSYFSSFGFGSSKPASAAAASAATTAPTAPPPVPAVPAAPAGAHSTDALSSIGDAFSGLIDIDGAAGAGDVDLFGGLSTHKAAPAPASALDKLVAAGAKATTTAAAPASTGGGKEGSGTATTLPDGSMLLPGLTEPLSSSDMFVFLSSGGSTATLSQLSLTPSAFVQGQQAEAAGALSALTGGGKSSAGGSGSAAHVQYVLDRDMLYSCMQVVRQLWARPHTTAFDFPLVPSYIPGGHAKLPAQGLVVPDFHTWLCEQGGPSPLLPLLLQGRTRSAMTSLLGDGGAGARGRAGTSGQGKNAAAGGGGDLFDLFAPQPAAVQPAAAPAAQDAATAAVPARGGSDGGPDLLADLEGSASGGGQGGQDGAYDDLALLQASQDL